MTATRDDAACTGAVVRKPPMKETALGECVAVPRALIYRGLTLAAAVICERNFCVMARTLLMVENSFCTTPSACAMSLMVDRTIGLPNVRQACGCSLVRRLQVT